MMSVNSGSTVFCFLILLKKIKYKLHTARMSIGDKEVHDWFQEYIHTNVCYVLTHVGTNIVGMCTLLTTHILIKRLVSYL